MPFPKRLDSQPVWEAVLRQEEPEQVMEHFPEWDFCQAHRVRFVFSCYQCEGIASTYD